jgi:uncharacterized HAD superfamily protein
MLIGCDIDGTVYPWSEAVNLALVEQFGIDDPGPHESWNYLRDRLDKEQWYWIWSREGAEAVFGRTEMMYPGAERTINALAREHEVHFVTHRNPYRLTSVTGAYLAHHFRNYRGVHVLDNSTSKHTLAQWDVFIDDKAEIAEEFSETEALMLVPARPWNVGVHGIRFEDWDEVPEAIAAYASTPA